MGLKPKPNSPVTEIPSLGAPSLLSNSQLGNPNINSNSQAGSVNSVTVPQNSSQTGLPSINDVQTGLGSQNNVRVGQGSTNEVKIGDGSENDVKTPGINPNGQGNLPLSQEHQLDKTLAAWQYLAMSKNQPNLQRNILQTNMVTPQQMMDTSKTQRDMARNNRAGINALQGPDVTSRLVGATAITSNANENAAKINEQVQGVNRSENLIVQGKMNQNKQMETAYKNEQIDLDNQNKVAQATVDNQNMLNFSNLTDSAFRGDKLDNAFNQGQLAKYEQADLADKQAQFEEQNQDLKNNHAKLNATKDKLTQNLSNLQQQYNTAIGSNNPNAAAIKQQLDQTQASLEKAQEDLINSESTYDALYKKHMGTAKEQLANSNRRGINMLGLNLNHKNSNAYDFKQNQIGTPSHVRRKQGGILPTYQKGKTLKKGLTEYASDQGLNFAANLIGSKKSERGFDVGDAITTGLSFVPGLSVAGSLIDNARDAYDEYKVGDLDYKDFIRYGADTATNVIPGMKAVKNAKKIGNKLGFLDKLKMFKSGGSLTLSEKKELEMYKNQLKEVADNSKELTKLQHEKLKDYIQERRKSSRINDDRIWKILSKMIKV